MSSPKDKLIDEHFSEVSPDDQYAISGEDITGIVSVLLHVLLAFMPPAQLKREIDRAWAQRVNDQAEEFERAKFRS